MRRALIAAAALALATLPARAGYSGPPALAIANALSELAAAGSQAAARANLGLGGMATQAPGSVAITGGSIAGLSMLGVTSTANGGLGGPWGASGQVYSSTGTASGAGSGGVGLLYDASHQVGYLGAIAPGSAWLPLYLQGSSFSLLSGGSTQGLYQDASGRVGIGTTAPALPLDVTGSGRVSGNLGVGGLTYRSTAPGVSAAGTTQSGATALTLELNVVTTAASGSGVQLAAWSGNSATAAQQQVWNRGANALAVYPPSGAQIEAGAANAAVSLAVGAHATFTCTSAAQCWQAP